VSNHTGVQFEAEEFAGAVSGRFAESADGSWKIDVFDAKVGGVGAKVKTPDAKVDGLGTQVAEIRHELREERKETKAGFEKLNERLESMQRLMFWAAVTIMVALLGSSSAIITALINSAHP
jgi:hypothetical protein